MNKSIKQFQFYVRLIGGVSAPLFILLSDYKENRIYLILLVAIYLFVTTLIRYKSFNPEYEIKIHKRMLYFDILMLSIAVVARGGIRSDFYLGYFLILGYVLLIRDKYMMVKISSWTILCYSIAIYFFSDPGTFDAGRLIIRMSLLVGTSFLLQNYLKQLLATEDMKEDALEMAFKDTLTGAYNRRMLEYLEGEHEHEPNKIQVALIDIDDFKIINDSYGHASGDEVLKQLSRVIQNHLGEEGVVIRYGGEEFLLILGDVDQRSAIQLLDSIRKDFSAINYTWKSDRKPITFTAGIASYVEGDSLNKIVRKADVALYKGKFEGKNRSVYHNNTEESQVI